MAGRRVRSVCVYTGVLLVALLAALLTSCGGEEEAETAGSPAASATTPTGTAAVATTVTAASPTPVPTPQAPDLGQLPEFAKPGAKNIAVRTFQFNDETFGELAYDLEERVASPGIGAHGEVTDWDRHYLEVHRWAGDSWERVFDLYEFVQAIYGPEELGSVVDNEPQTATAIVGAELTPVEFEAEIGDVLFLETSLFLGPEGIQHPSPTITALVWTDGDFHIAYSEEFGVRGGMVSVEAQDGYIELIVDAYLETDALCCPSGWEILRLAPTTLGDLGVEERCVGPEHSYCLAQ